MKKILTAALAAMMVLSLAGCGGSGGAGSSSNASAPSSAEGSGASGESGSAAGGKKLKIALVADGAGFGSQSFNDVAMDGAERFAADTGAEIVPMEITEIADLANGMRTLAGQGVDLIVGISANCTEAVAEVSVEYPDIKFLLLDSKLEGYDNVSSSFYRDQEAAFLLGALGAKLSETKKIGYIGGISSEIQDRAQYGYTAGAKTADPSVEVVSSYTGSFSDVGKGKEMSSMMYSNGVDYIAPYAGACNLGVFQSAKEQNNYVFGAANGQFDKMPDKIVASQVKRIDNVLYGIAKSIADGSFVGGKAVEYGLADGGVALMYSEMDQAKDVVSQEIKAEIAELEKKVIDGSVSVPKDEAEYKAMS